MSTRSSHINYAGGNPDKAIVEVDDHASFVGGKFLSIERHLGTTEGLEPDERQEHYLVLHNAEDFTDLLANILSGGREAFGDQAVEDALVRFHAELSDEVQVDIEDVLGGIEDLVRKIFERGPDAPPPWAPPAVPPNPWTPHPAPGTGEIRVTD